MYFRVKILKFYRYGIDDDKKEMIRIDVIKS